MAIATSTFTGLPARGHRLPGRPRREQRARVVQPPQGRLRATAQGAVRGAGRRPRRAPGGSRHPAAGRSRSARSSGSTATRASRRTSRRTRRTSGRASRGSSDRPTAAMIEADGSAHGNGGYFNFQPGEMYVGGGMWMAEKARLDAFRRAIVEDPDRVRAALEEPGFKAAFGTVDRPRASQARADGSAGRPPDGGPVPVQGRRLRPARCPTTRCCRRRCRTLSRTPSPRGCRSSASSRRSARNAVDAVRSGLLGPSDRLAGAPRCVSGGGAGRLGQPVGRRPPARRRGRSRRTPSSRAGRRSPRSRS